MNLDSCAVLDYVLKIEIPILLLTSTSLRISFFRIRLLDMISKVV